MPDVPRAARGADACAGGRGRDGARAEGDTQPPAAAELAVVPKEVGGRRVIRILNGEATLVTTRADGTSYYASLCAGKVSCAAFTIETGIADAFIEQANGNLTAIGVEVPTGRRLEANTASIHRRLSEEGDCPCADGWVKYEGEWVQGKRHGAGRLVQADGGSYVGEWREDMKHGKGKDVFASGWDVASQECQYKKGKMHGPIAVTYADGKAYIGRCDEDENVGLGVKWSADRAQAWEVQDGQPGRSISQELSLIHI